MLKTSPKNSSVYQEIYEIVRKIPQGKVATYGQIAALVGNCTPRMVGYAMAATPSDLEIPWQRVINSQGRISVRGNGKEDELQRQLLHAEGIVFDKSGCVNLREFQWRGTKE